MVQPAQVLPHSPGLDYSDAKDPNHKAIARDECFYFTDVIILVEETLFKVPRYPFVRSSEVFRAMFSLPVWKDATPEGSSDQNPLFLDGIKKTDFIPLLKVMFPIFPSDNEHMMRDEWISVLTLATMWQMDQIQDLAIQKILLLPASVEDWISTLKMSALRRLPAICEKAKQEVRHISVVDRILLAHECDIVEWIGEGYTELVVRDETISEEDEMRLGTGVTMKLLRMREKYHQYNPSWDGYFDLDEAIKTIPEATSR